MAVVFAGVDVDVEFDIGERRNLGESLGFAEGRDGYLAGVLAGGVGVDDDGGF